jgi:DNA-binding NtrC family response regulator
MATILVLDDVLDAVRLVKRILEESGHTVFPFTDEDEALAFVAKTEIDLAILDVKLKKRSGVEVLASLRKISPATRAIILTGYPTVETAHQSMHLGASDYCVKPIDNDELESKVCKVLGAS